MKPAATETKPDGLDNLATQAQATIAPPMGEGSTDLDVAARAGQGPAPEISNSDAIKGALIAAREIFCLFTKLESPRATMADDSLANLAQLWGAVCDKRQINLAGYMGDYAAELAAVVVTFTLAANVRAGVLAELAARKGKAVETDTATAPDSLDAGRPK